MRSRQQAQTDLGEIAAPVGGLNARDPLALMSSSDARVLENMIPRSSDLELRSGFRTHSSSAGSSNVSSLASLPIAAASDKLFAFANSNIYDVSTLSGTASSIASGLTNDNWQTEVFYDRLFMVNGADAPRDHDGTTLSSTGWTGSGLTISNLVNVASFKERLYFVEKNTKNLWHGAVRGVTGALTKFDLGGFIKGELYTVSEWSRDTGSGDTTQLVLVSTEGEVLIYSGDYPGGTFSLSRRFTIPRLLSRNCLIPLGSDLLAVTRGGVFPLSGFLEGRPEGTESVISDKINTRFKTLADSYESQDGWTVINYEDKRLLIINVPTGAISSQQFVFNTQTGAACVFTGMTAKSWCIHENKPYFGGINGKVYEADNGTSDDGAPISYVMECAFNYLKSNVTRKKFNRIKPNFLSSATTEIFGGLCTDFTDRDLTPHEFTITVQSTPWGSAWGSPWSIEAEVYDRWVPTRGRGKNVALRYSGSTSTASIKYVSTQIMYEHGGML